jgi:hypothetical protein
MQIILIKEKVTIAKRNKRKEEVLNTFGVSKEG